MERGSCKGCKHHLGGGCCRLNVEAECGKGERELYEPEEADDGKWYHVPKEDMPIFLVSAVISLAVWGTAFYKLYLWITC